MNKNKILKILVVVFVVLISTFTFGCEDRQVISKTITDKQYTQEYTETYSEDKYKYNWWVGEFQLVPQVKTRIVPECWSVTVTYEFDKGSNVQSTYEVTQDEWNSYQIGDTWVDRY